MSDQYAGGFISKTPPTVTTSSAQGMWTLSQQMQYQQAGSWPSALPPTTIGQAYGGGFYAGQIAVGGGGVATHYLIVAPKATGEASGKTWGLTGVTTAQTSVIDGPTNTTVEAALGAAYQAATFCVGLNAGSGLNGKTDWYLPAKNELEVLYYFLKPTTGANNTSSGSNANAVSPEPISTNYTSGSPAQTAATDFQSGGVQAFAASYYWSSTEVNSNDAQKQAFSTGPQINDGKNYSDYVRAVRRVPI